MELVFKKKEERLASTIKSYGTIASIIGAKGKIEPTNVNRALVEQKVALKCNLVKENGDALENVVCSKNVMKDLYSQKLSLSGLKFLELIESFADKTALDPETNTYEKVYDDNGIPVKEKIFIISYAGTNTEELTVTVTEEDLLKAQTALRTIDWSELVAI